MIIQEIQQRVDEELLARKYLDYSRRLLRKLEKQLRELEKEAAEQGKWKPSQIHEADRIDHYMTQLRQEVIQYNEMLNLQLENDLVSVYISEHQWTQQFLREIAKPRATYTFNRVSTGAVKKLLSGMTITDGKGRARTLRDYLTGYSRDLAGQSEKIIMDSIALGDSVDNTVAELRKLHTTVSKTRLENTVRTWAVKAHTEANLDVYQQADVKRVQWCAALDMRTCATCAAKDGKVYNLSQLKKVPPIHPRCRCCLLPIVDSNDIFDSEKDGYRAWLANDNRSEKDLLELRKRVLATREISLKERKSMVEIIDQSLSSKGVNTSGLIAATRKPARIKRAMKSD